LEWLPAQTPTKKKASYGCEAFCIPDDKRKFMARTISAGVPLELSDPILLEAVRQTKSVVFLDTASRFMKSNDENAAAQNRQLVNDVIALLAAGAVTAVLVHHATKNSRKETMTLENMLRGSSDLGAMCDQAYGIRKDDALYANGAGPMEIDLVNLKDREQIGRLTALRLATSYTTPGRIGAASYINERGDFKVVELGEMKQRLEDLLVQFVKEDPTAPEANIAKELCPNKSGRTIGRMLNKLGWHRVKGGPDGASPWHNDQGKPCPYLAAQQQEQAAKEAAKKVKNGERVAKAAEKQVKEAAEPANNAVPKQVTLEEMEKPAVALAMFNVEAHDGH
jgi:AAA domain